MTSVQLVRCLAGIVTRIKSIEVLRHCNWTSETKYLEIKKKKGSLLVSRAQLGYNLRVDESLC